MSVSVSDAMQLEPCQTTLDRYGFDVSRKPAVKRCHSPSVDLDEDTMAPAPHPFMQTNTLDHYFRPAPRVPSSFTEEGPVSVDESSSICRTPKKPKQHHSKVEVTPSPVKRAQSILSSGVEMTPSKVKVLDDGVSALVQVSDTPKRNEI
jgi:hypothetical protein